MALIVCSKCGDKVNDRARFCPHCGLSENNSLQIENKIVLGKYPQNNQYLAEPIEWTVIEIKENKALLISNYCLDCKVYDESYCITSWYDSYIRRWLNDEFYNSVFSCEEQNCIRQVRVNNENTIYVDGEEINIGWSTEDKVFLLSFNETQKYLSSFKAQATKVAIQNGAYCKDENYCSWWLRTPGKSKQANIFWPNGTFSNIRGVNDTDIAVRPAVWVDIANLPKNSFVTDDIEYNSIDLKEFKIQNNILIKYIGRSTNVIIPKNVTEIASEAFEGCTSIQTVIISNNVTKIGERVFRYCSNLENLIIPNSVSQIGMASFVQCTSLSRITLSQNIKEIPMGLFSGCNSLRRIRIPNSVTRIGTIAFINCSSLEHIIMPQNLQQIGDSAFANCSILKNIEIPFDTKTIGEKAFENCINLNDIVIPQAVTEIKRQTFKGCENLTRVVLKEQIRNIDSYAFWQCAKLIIYAPSGSYAEEFANKNNIISICDDVIEHDYSEEFNYDTSHDIETDNGPDDDIETYEYYYGDDEIVGNDEWY